jgi:hypothetical protein
MGDQPMMGMVIKGCAPPALLLATTESADSPAVAEASG